MGVRMGKEWTELAGRLDLCTSISKGAAANKLTRGAGKQSGLKDWHTRIETDDAVCHTTWFDHSRVLQWF